MKISYLLDDSAARLPLAIRSLDGVWDRAAELRSAPGIQLVELTTQHMLNTGATLFDELAAYFDTLTPSEADPYALATCYAHRDALEDLWHNLRDRAAALTAFHEVEALFPASYTRELHFTLALTAVGVPAFGYVRTYTDSEGDESHGIVVNLAQARPHLAEQLGQFSFSLLADTICHSLFNHESFLVAYADYCQSIHRVPDKPSTRLKDTLLSRGMAWYLSYRHDQPFYDRVLGWDPAQMSTYAAQWADLLDEVRRRGFDEPGEDWLYRREARRAEEQALIDLAGYGAVRAVAAAYGQPGLREAISQGAEHFLLLYNALDGPRLKM